MMMQQWEHAHHADLKGDVAAKYHGGIGADGHAACRDAAPQVAKSLHRLQRHCLRTCDRGAEPRSRSVVLDSQGRRHMPEPICSLPWGLLQAASSVRFPQR